MLGLALSSLPSAREIGLYEQWARMAADGSWLGRDLPWEYPPLALVPVAWPLLVGADDPRAYWLAFCLGSYVVDAAVLALLLGGKHRGTTGAWIWVLGLAALGPVAYQRFDLLTALAVVAAVRIARSGRAAAPALVLGGLVKVWPLVMLGPYVLFSRRRTRDAVVAASCLAAAAAALAAAGYQHVGTVLRFQSDRGLQVESIAATPLNLARAAGLMQLDVERRYGALELVGAGVPGLVMVVEVTGAAALLIVMIAMLRRARHPGNDVTASLWSLLLVLVLVVSNKVLSPQYLIWLLALVALVAGAAPARRTHWLGVLAVGAAGLTHSYYPYLYQSVLRAEPLPLSLLVMRNGLLLLLLALVLREVRRDAPPRARQGHGAPQTVASG